MDAKLRAEITQGLQHLLAWPEIARSGQLARFLDYIVTRTLAGETQSIKAYSIAVDVFGRKPDFDPQTDPIVRVQARRLRGLLEQYYAGPGLDAPVRIVLPVGRYVPDFVARAPTEPQHADAVTSAAGNERELPHGLPPATRGQVTLSWFALAAVTLGAAIVAVALSTWGARQDQLTQSRGLLGAPAVTVMEFQNLTGHPADISLIAGLAVEMVTDLEQFETASVHYGAAGTGEDGRAPASDYVLSGILRRDNARLQYGAILTEAATGTVVWNRTIVLESFQTTRPDLLNYVSGLFTRVLGSPRGPLHARARTLLEQGNAVVGSESLYLCRLLFDLYRENESFAAAERARQCYAALREQERNTGQAQAAIASLAGDALMRGGSVSQSANELHAFAERGLIRAIQAAPVSGFVWEQQARFLQDSGRHEAAEAAYSSALQLNPANTDAMMSRARHLALLGRLTEAGGLANTALDGAPSPPAWYFGVPALEALHRGDFGKAAEHAQVYAEADRELGPLLAVMAGQGLRDAELVNRYLPRVLEVPGFRAHGIVPQLRRRVVDEQLLDAIGAALLLAGVPETAIDGPF